MSPKVLLMALALVACRSPGAASTTPAAPTTLGPSTTSAPAPTDPCQPGNLPIEATGIASALDADYDSDGVVDTFTTYLESGIWYARIELSGGEGDVAAVEGTDASSEVIPVGGHDLDDDGVPEAFLTVGAGAATRLVGLFSVEVCDLRRVNAGAAPAVFPVGASVANVSGITCNGRGDLDRIFASSTDGATYQGGSEPFDLEGDTLTAGAIEQAIFTAEEAGALARLDCGLLSLP